MLRSPIIRAGSLALALLSLSGCALLPVTPKAALPVPLRQTPGPGERVEKNRQGMVLLRQEYLVDERGKVWRHGKEWSYWPDGTLRALREFDHDEPRGTWQAYYADGTLRMEHVADPLRATPMVYFHPNGQKASEGMALCGRREGLWTYWFAHGQVGEQGRYVNGKREGMWKAFYPDGREKSKGAFSAGEKVAPWQYW